MNANSFRRISDFPAVPTHHRNKFFSGVSPDSCAGRSGNKQRGTFPWFQQIEARSVWKWYLIGIASPARRCPNFRVAVAVEGLAFCAVRYPEYCHARRASIHDLIPMLPKSERIICIPEERELKTAARSQNASQENAEGRYSKECHGITVPCSLHPTCE